jgi:ATP-dependent DNA helicase RecG
LVEISETLEIKNVKEEYEKIQKIFPKFKVELLHGKMKDKEKN